MIFEYGLFFLVCTIFRFFLFLGALAPSLPSQIHADTSLCQGE